MKKPKGPYTPTDMAYLGSPRAKSGASYSVKAEIWSLGLSLVELATGVYPYSRSTALDAILMPRVRLHAPANYPQPGTPSDEYDMTLADMFAREENEARALPAASGSSVQGTSYRPANVYRIPQADVPAEDAASDRPSTSSSDPGTPSDEYDMTLADMFAREEDGARALPAASGSSVRGSSCRPANFYSIPQADMSAEDAASDTPYPSPSDSEAWDTQRLSLFAVIDAIVSGPPPVLPHSCRHIFSDDFRDFVELCLLKSPYERPGLTMLMNHPWIRKELRENVCIAHWIIETMQF
ncbi:uncharacterized protein LOC111059431 [Nilaparvata lugens]|uniref:uncharacterized protein LOC111059431 n=1 Tax=Nilaparvata lugens TaxID=108931 RepID=UPI00193CB8B9|nr:uncharacterized protein LOC111059431 [Nilaparvata lugens]